MESNDRSEELDEEAREEERLRLEKLEEHKKSLEKAAKERREMVMKFSAEWCSPCKEMDKETFGDQSVKDYMDDNNVLLKVDIDQNPGLAEKYDVSSLPLTLVGEVVQNENGEYEFKPRERLEGKVSAEDLLEELKDK